MTSATKRLETEFNNLSHRMDSSISKLGKANRLSQRNRNDRASRRQCQDAVGGTQSLTEDLARFDIKLLRTAMNQSDLRTTTLCRSFDAKCQSFLNQLRGVMPDIRSNLRSSTKKQGLRKTILNLFSCASSKASQ